MPTTRIGRPLAMGVLVLTLAASGAAWRGGTAHGDEARELPPVLLKLSQMIGGRWETKGKLPDGKPVGEMRFEWGPGRRTIHSTGRVMSEDVRAVFGWDPTARKVYYLDIHGPSTVYFGHATLEGEEVVFEFRTLVGPEQTWVSRERFLSPDSLEAVMRQMKDGKPQQAHTINLERVR